MFLLHFKLKNKARHKQETVCQSQFMSRACTHKFAHFDNREGYFTWGSEFL